MVIDMIYNYDNLNFNILTVEKISHTNKSFTVKERPYAALSLRLNGTSRFIINNKHFETSGGDVFFIPANVAYQVDYSSSEIIVIHLLDCDYNEAECIRTNNDEGIYKLFCRMLDEWMINKSVNKAKSCVYEILYKLECINNNSSVIRPIEFERCLSYLEGNYTNTYFNIKELCNHEYLSRSSLQRYFLRYLGLTPKQYLLELRLSKAIDLLTNESKTISEISFACGFKDEKYFSRIFKQVYGISPTDARNRTKI